jgi:hypothetical protein
MGTKNQLMNTAYLRECFLYDAESGFLQWRIRPREHFRNNTGWHNFNHQFAGCLAGWVKANGRREIKLDGRAYKAARIIWALHVGHGNFGQIDHIDGNPANNKLSNLRDVTARQNAQNRNVNVPNSSGIRNVTWHKQAKKWWVRITVEGVTRSFGLFDDLDEAVSAAEQKRRDLFGEFARA